MCPSIPSQLPKRRFDKTGLELPSLFPAACRCLKSDSLTARDPFIFLSFEASDEFIASLTDSELHVSLPPPAVETPGHKYITLPDFREFKLYYRLFKSALLPRVTGALLGYCT